MSALFDPITLRGLTIPNRIVVSPMCQYSAAGNGQVNAWHHMHILSLALSGAGMFCIEATAVEPEGRITPGCLGLWDDATETALATLLVAVRTYSKTPIIIQLAHAGRKGSSHVPWEGGQLIPPAQGGWIPPAPSAIPQKEGEAPPTALDRAGMDAIVTNFVEASHRAVRLGIDGIELHAAHGYLLHEFLSPISNHRTDEYGGPLENRLRFPLEVFDAVRGALPAQMPLGVKVSATDWMNNGWDLPQTIEFARAVRARGVDWITASSGGISPLQKITVGPNYQVPFADAIKRETGVTTIAVGLITEPQQANEIIASGKADMVALARAMLYDPRWPWHAAAELGATVSAPPQYWRSQPASQKALFGQTPLGQR